MKIYRLHMYVDSDEDFRTFCNTNLYTTEELDSCEITRYYISRELLKKDVCIIYNDLLRGLKYQQRRLYLNETKDHFREAIKRTIKKVLDGTDFIWDRQYGNQYLLLETDTLDLKTE